MQDFYEALDFCAFDVTKASAMVGEAKPLREVIEDILEEAGLDAVASVPTEPITACDR